MSSKLKKSDKSIFMISRFGTLFSIIIPFQPPVYAATLYDAVYQFAVALNKTLMNNEPPDGTVILKYLTDYSFESMYIPI